FSCDLCSVLLDSFRTAGALRRIGVFELLLVRIFEHQSRLCDCSPFRIRRGLSGEPFRPREVSGLGRLTLALSRGRWRGAGVLFIRSHSRVNSDASDLLFPVPPRNCSWRECPAMVSFCCRSSRAFHRDGLSDLAGCMVEAFLSESIFFHGLFGGSPANGLG